MTPENAAGVHASDVHASREHAGEHASNEHAREHDALPKHSPHEHVAQALDVTLLAAKIEEYIAALSSHPETRVREATHQLLDGIDALHREALGRIVVGLGADPELRDRIAEDPVVRLVFQLYGLFREDEVAAAESALDAVRAYIESHGGRIEVLSADDGVIRVRLAGSCHGCSGSAVTLKRGVEAALREHYPGFRELVAEDLGDEASIDDTLPRVVSAPAERPVFVDALPFSELPDAGLRGVTLDGVRVLLVRLGSDVYAYRNACLESPLPLEFGTLDGDALHCPWHQCVFDARTGRAQPPLTGELEPYPVAVDGAMVRVAVNARGLASSTRGS